MLILFQFVTNIENLWIPPPIKCRNIILQAYVGCAYMFHFSHLNISQEILDLWAVALRMISTPPEFIPCWNSDPLEGCQGEEARLSWRQTSAFATCLSFLLSFVLNCVYYLPTHSNLEVEFMYAESMLVRWALRNSYVLISPLSQPFLPSSIPDHSFQIITFSDFPCVFLSCCPFWTLPWFLMPYSMAMDVETRPLQLLVLCFSLDLSTCLFISFVLVFWSRVSVYKLGWPQTWGSHPNSASPVWGQQMWATTPSLSHSFLILW